MSMLERSQIYSDTNVPITSGLFTETNHKGYTKVVPVFSLYGANPEYINFMSLYVSLCKNDPTEYTFCKTVFGDWKYWSYLREQKFFQNGYQVFKDEAEVARKSEAFQTVISEATNPESKSRLAAARFLIDEPWKSKSKETKKSSKETTVKAADVFKEDLERLQEQGLVN